MNSERTWVADEPATIKDVAEAVGVSTRTVSRVMRNEGGYSKGTAERVRQAIDDMDYFPNLLARGLSGLRSGTIGLVGPNMTDPFFPDLADELQRAARKLGFKTFFTSTFREPETQQEVLGSLRSYGVDGIIVHPTRGTYESVKRFAASGTPTVVLDQSWAGQGLTSVSADIGHGARLAVEHLVATGRSRIAMINGSTANTTRRMDGYHASLPSDAIPIVESAPPDAVGGRDAMQKLLAREPELDAVFAYNDLMALGAMGALAESGRQVPEDVALVGYDDILFTGVIRPALTTVRYDRRRVAEEAVALLLAIADDRTLQPEPVIVPVELVIREST